MLADEIHEIVDDALEELFLELLAIAKLKRQSTRDRKSDALKHRITTEIVREVMQRLEDYEQKEEE